MGKRPFSERTTATKQLHLVYIYGHPSLSSNDRLPKKYNSLFFFVSFFSLSLSPIDFYTKRQEEKGEFSRLG